MKRKNLLILFLVFLIIFSSSVRSQSKDISFFDLEITKSGTIFSDSGIRSIELNLYIPQENLINISVEPDNWEFVNDSYGNKMIKIKWVNPRKEERYRVVFRIKNKAKEFEKSSSENKYWTPENSLIETALTKQTDAIKEIAYGQETKLEKAVRLTKWINKNIKYDRAIENKKTESSEWTMKNKRGVCGELSNLLVAMLRSQDIPAKFIVGYAYSPSSLNSYATIESHAWVEAFIDNRWISIDPTWLELGYLDAAHIKFAELPDSNFTQYITWRGFGKAEWKKDPITYNLIEIKRRRERKIRIDANNTKSEKYSVLHADVEDENCSMAEIIFNSCVDEDGNDMLDVFGKTRTVWLCPKQELYWLFVPRGKNYICPVSVLDQSGTKSRKNITISGVEQSNEIFIDGPDQVLVDENFKIKSDIAGLFFSSNLTSYKKGDWWQLKLKEPGTYEFYFFSENGYGKKKITALQMKEIDIAVNITKNITAGQNLTAEITIRNLLDKKIPVDLTITLGNHTIRKSLTLLPDEEKSFNTTFFIAYPGEYKLRAMAESKTISSCSKKFLAVERKGIWKKDIDKSKKKVKTFTKIIQDFLKNVLTRLLATGVYR